MAKTIKFNLNCDNHQVRTLDDLRNNFSIEDILQYYKDGILEKWLTVRGYTKELEALKAVKSDSPLEIINKLVSIFDVESDKHKIEYATSIIKYKEERVLANQIQEEQVLKSNAQYEKYFSRYEKLKSDIKENPQNKSKIQSVISEIECQYSWIFNIDYRNFFFEIKDISPLAIICFLMNSFTRKYFIPDEISKKVNKCEQDIIEMYKWINKSVNDNSFIEALGECVKKKQQLTGNSFVDVTNKKCLILKLQNTSYTRLGTKISESSSNENFLTADKIDGKFLILEGLQYQSETDNSVLYYIEI